MLGTLGVITGSTVIKVKEVNCLGDHPARRIFLFPVNEQDVDVHKNLVEWL